MRIKRIPRALAHPYAPTLVTKPTETTPNVEAVPARPGADRHVLDHKPPGILDCYASARREPIEPAQWPPAPPSVAMLDFRWTRGAVEIE
jgi:hypothetical protein